MNAIVTGGCGFIGTNLVDHLLRAGHGVVCLDKMTYASCWPQPVRGEMYTLVKGDVCSKADVAKAFSACDSAYGKPSIVFHLAAETHVDRSISEATPFSHTNVCGTQVVCDACLEHGARLLYMSTDEVYGSLKPGEVAKEVAMLVPSSAYSASKVGGEAMAMSYMRTHGMYVMVARASNNYGPYQNPEKLIPLMIKKAAADLPLPVYGDGMNEREWMHVSDTCSALECIAKYGSAGDIYNVGTGDVWTNIDIVKAILDAMGKPHSLIGYVADRKGHDRRYALDCSKIANDIGWEPMMCVREALANVVEWYAEQFKEEAQ